MRGGRAVVPAERGATRIADRVVAKIASRAALEALGATAPPEEHEPPRASVVVHDGSARVRVLIELDYPADIGARCRAVRERIAERVGELTGMEVPEVIITVERLHSAHTGRLSGVRVR
ncbi:Asp23/Gls24 family envelope stress response protein [Streptomyces sp. UNOB3_S3]|uniref:Asp23/Gls24 family envelope stress response protein n=1 Tax=Streptomyces sp. UNOB3_S3 TaxID=2871682 RepID=UPI001E58D0B7|nr:Asp23/Gls24 family envelope stress response protein [Streptomyces sp. UNOB3_S3]